MVDSVDSNVLISDTTARQMRAATPNLSAWVSANAGSGKTHVLSQRVVRLLLNGTRPSAILCLTYTKAAAAEMSNRIFKMLGDWTRMDDQTLTATLSKLEGAPPKLQKLSVARRLFAQALETPGGLKIQTIHAFCEALLHRFPLEANVPGHFEVLDDISAIAMLDEARRQILAKAATQKDSALSHTVAQILDLSGEHGLNKLMDEIIQRRHALLDYLNFTHDSGGLIKSLAERLEIDPQLSEDDYISKIWPVPSLSDDVITSFHHAAFQGSGKTPQDMAQKLMAAKDAADPLAKSQLLKEAFLTKAGQPRKIERTISKPIAQMMPQLIACFEAAQAHILKFDDLITRRKCLDASVYALTLAQYFIGLFDGLKRRQAKLDYDDLIIQTANLFKRSGAGSWVHYKLDQGIDHILVDEAQDTSPDQWTLIQSLADEFFAGDSARQLERTLFAVGDEKQSIYSFQGAKPERFDEEQRQTSKRAAQADKPFESIALRVSFRSTADILDMVDLIFADETTKQGLTFSDNDIIHQSVRQKAPGSVELWDVIAKSPTQTNEDWLAPLDQVSERDPIKILSSQIAITLEDWIGKETIIDHKTNQPRFIKAGDIMILVRKRDAFVPSLMRVLKTDTNIPVAGADRLRLTDHIATQDLIALGKVILLKEDDLSLASLLKSPFFNVTEGDLFDLCAKRNAQESVWAALVRSAAAEPKWQAVVNQLDEYAGLLAQYSVHDFYAHILTIKGMRQKFLNRNGTEVTDVLDGFLDAALEHDQSGIAGLQSFLSTLERSKPDIKREQEQDLDAVRIMTVHASKGLEAPIVFLVDPGSAPYHASHADQLLEYQNPEHQNHLPSAFFWLPNASFHHQISQSIKDEDAKRAEEEYRRLLYVGLTRAADRLVVCGYRGVRELKEPTWHEMVAQGFDRAAPHFVSECERGEKDHIWNVRRFEILRQKLENLPTNESSVAQDKTISRPKCLDEKMPQERGLPRPLVPSGVGTLVEEHDHLPQMRSPFLKASMMTRSSVEYGNAVHRLLQVLPTLHQDEWTAKANHYLKNVLPNETEETRLHAYESVIKILTEEKWRPLFEHDNAIDNASEFSIMGEINVAGEKRLVSGRIDRLVVLKDRILILDYKTNARTPQTAEEVPDHYRSQLAIYREVLKPLYPDHSIEAALLYTRQPILFEMSAKQLDQAMNDLSNHQ